MAAAENHHMTDADERQMLDAIAKWIEKKVAPVAMQLEHDDIWPAELVEDMKELGLFGALIDPEYGGLGLTATTYSKIVTMIAEEWMSLTGIFNSHLMMAQIVQRFGTPARRNTGCRALRPARYAAGWVSPSRMPAPICRRSAPRQSAWATNMSSMVRRPGFPTPFRAMPARCWSRPTPAPSRATRG